MVILQYQTGHRARCVEIFDSNVGEYFAPWERSEFIEFLDSLDVGPEYYVCISDGQVVACGGVRIKSPIAELAWGMVHKDCHGKGIGTILTDYRLLYLEKSTGIECVKIDTSQHTEGFYKKRGFIVTKSIHNGFGEGIDCVSMKLVTGI
ncbi:GNAT family N-acetyltransferase [Saccharospirillum impatiens]|uniref:GNAT family N-acetyltransferase n=1 Tax=Saccharospirillum impatiens TaxID=169438 RepID=UPI00048CC305|nr:GNAT family N-acetyltransferase [Saccharospirillum impatiens]